MDPSLVASSPWGHRPDVDLLRWPAEAHRRDVDRHRACLWLLAPGELPPELGRHEDWIRLPADERDVHARLQRLAARSAVPPLSPEEPLVGPDGSVRRCGAVLHLPMVEAAILRTLALRPDQVTPRAVLQQAVWGDAPRSRRALDRRVHSLRTRLGPVGLAVHTIRGRGFLLSAEPT